ncbi:MAG: dynamin family protein [Proteobacteria bacterium]|nr:dynamin family protein [Desulfobulbaceae bacterium]MBU4153362.1 dynamin family protein [Pseudomonadota bacterium]
MDEKALQNKIQSKVRAKLSSLFARYNTDFNDLDSLLKWKPVVLVLGNYSSGKSTFINELIGREVQRTGQAPTDDSFTVITASTTGSDEPDVPGSDLVNDVRLPFTSFKTFGEQFISHFRMKRVHASMFENLAVIDSPGMLDSISEKDRGYDYSTVIKDFARLADLVVLMFDPHKAGTIQETYNTIRNILPEATGEDRVLFVLSRIDECDNLGDLVRSYGTLCWNLSQMTGRKDIPRIFLTFSPKVVVDLPPELAVWAREREHLKQEILSAAGLRINHILQNVDKQIQEVRMVAEAMAVYAEGGMKILTTAMKRAFAAGSLCFLFLDIGTKRLWGFPEKGVLQSLLAGEFVAPAQLMIPVAGVVLVLSMIALFFLRWQLPRHAWRCRQDLDRLVPLETVYRRNLWERVKGKVSELLSAPTTFGLFAGHQGNVAKLDRFSKGEMQEYYKKLAE